MKFLTTCSVLTLSVGFILSACDRPPSPTALEVGDPVGAAFLESGGDALVVDFAVTGDSRGWWVAKDDGTLRAEGSAAALDLGLDGERVVATVTSRDGRGVLALTDDARLHVAHPNPTNWFPQPSEWHPNPTEWEPVDLAVGPADRSAWVLFAPVGDTDSGKLAHVTPDGATWSPIPPFHWHPVAMAMTPDGRGVWVLDRDGAVTAFGSAPDLGSFPEPDNWAPADVAATPSGHGLWLLGESGRVIAVGDAEHQGNLHPTPDNWALALAPTRSGKGYRVLDSSGDVTGFGNAADRSTGRPHCDPKKDWGC